MSITIYKDSAANAIFIEDANGVQFLNSLQATAENGTCSILDTARNIQITTNIDFNEYIDESGNTYGSNSIEVCNSLNAIFSSSGTPTLNIPVITSSLAISLTEGETLNYELTADYGVGYEWDLSNVSGVTTVEGNPRKLIGGSGLSTGEYAIPVKAINYNGEDSQIIELSVGSPAFANTKSINFNNNDWLGANAGILDNTLGRNANGTGSSDAWTISLFFKAGTASNASQTILYFGNQDVANQGYIQLKYNGQNTGKRLELRYGSNNNRLNLNTPNNSITVGQWHHILISYNGGTTGSSSSNMNDYYSRFKIFIDEVQQTTNNFHNNFGYTGSIIGQNWRVGRWNNGQSLRNNCRVDELAVYNDDVSSLVSDIYNNGKAVDLMSLSTQPEHWWRMGDGDSYPYLFDVGFQANCIFIMNSMTSADIVNDVP
jgi:hypothetical protein